MSEIVAWRYRWQHDTKWVHNSEEPEAYPNRIVEPLCVALQSDLKPFSTYPEDRARMLKLCSWIDNSYSDSSEFIDSADALSDLVQAILTDEAVLVEGGGL